MKKIILIPDSFKGTLSSIQICNILTRAVQELLPGVEVRAFPVGDGGEGTAEAFFHAAGGQRVSCTVKVPHFETIPAAYTLLPDLTAVMDMAEAAGLSLCGDKPDPMETTTYGVGQMIADAAARGCKSLILGLGGSGTNDGGCGAACALGVQFFDGEGKPFIPTGGTLSRIRSIDCSRINPDVSHIPITCMCDVDTPFFGEKGAAAVFAPQKGASPEQVEVLDRGLRHLALRIEETLHLEIAGIPGSGAAGGMGGGCFSFLHAELKSGIETVLNVLQFDRQAEGADLILTGEGKIDAQSVCSKVVCGVSKRAQKLKIPCVAIVGEDGGDYDPLYGQGLTAVFPINRSAVAFEITKAHSEENLYRTACDILRLVRQYR